jgi:hypothetical protein
MTFDGAIPWERGLRWQVICSDGPHWRVGIYSPPEAHAREVRELERHDCPELFLLMEGRITLVFRNEQGVLCELVLSPGAPVLITSPHGAYCPDGPFTGVALVVERSEFETEMLPMPAVAR